MRKILTPLLVLLVFTISACGSSEEPEPTATTVVETVEEIVVETEPSVVEAQASEAVCVVQSPAEDLLEEDDWVDGLEEGFSVTIIEYGDYQ